METGTQLGAYKVQRQLGAGGMGEVWLARDARLDRDVAIKVLPAELSADPERLARLEREARVLASLDHPNVAAIYGLEESDGVQFLVMQLAAGETLEARLEGGAMQLDDALAVAAQIADGLEAAHEGGVVHRDLKPANIMVAPGGEVKILDFGLAKALGSDSSSDSRASDLTASPTMMAVTSAGMILGTAAYMSPEQARGRPLDRRTDIWSFGCVLFEMLAGEKAFSGETVTDVMAAIVTRDPDWTRLPESMPGWLAILLKRCLDKNSRQRLRDAGEARIILTGGHDLAGGVADVDGSAITPSTASVRGRAATALLAVGMLVIGAGAGWWVWGNSSEPPSPRYVAWHEPGVAFENQQAQLVAVAPDGRAVAIVGRDATGPGIWFRRLDQPNATKIVAGPASDLAWSPDGQQLAFIAWAGADEVRTHDLRTGASTLRYRGEGVLTSPAWTAAGELTVADKLGTALRIMEIPGDGAESVLVTIDNPGNIELMAPIGAGRFLLSNWSQLRGGVETVILGADGQITEPLFRLDAAVHWVPPDLVLFARDGSLWAQRLDVESGELRGDAVALVVNIDTAAGITPWLAAGADVLAYRTGSGDEAPTVLEWVDRAGQLVRSLGDPANYYDPRIAPGGEDFVFDLSDQGDAGDIWLARGDGLSSRLTSAASDETRPVWSPDGNRVVLETSVEGEVGSLYFKDVNDPAGALTPVGAPADVVQATDWVGNTIVANDRTFSTIWIVDATTGTSRPYRETRFADYAGALSPDASRIVYLSNETGRDEVWVESFPVQGERRRLSAAGASSPVWRRDGREILYQDFDGVIMSLPVRSLEPLEIGAPEPVFEVELRPHGIRQFDLVPDGQRFLINRLVEAPDLPLRLLFGWRQELARLAGPDW
jgi:hypothetical protein